MGGGDVSAKKRPTRGAGIDRFASKAQWRWAFRTKKTWAKRWAKKSPKFAALPKRKHPKGSR